MNTGLDFWTIFSLLFLVTAIPVAVMIILEKRSPYKTVAWILVLILIPILGLFFYLIFGQEYRKRKLYSRKGVKSLGEFRKLSSKQLRKIDQTHFSFNGKRLKNENIIRLDRKSVV